jgi:predicted  nucleic acid-binding Zn-ribbon protein
MDQDLKDYLNQRFDAVDAKIDAVDAKIDAVDAKIDTKIAAVYMKIDAVDAKIDAVDAKIDAKIAAVYTKIDAVQASMFQRIDEIAAALEEGYRDTQTEVLKAVYSMGERLQLRASTQDTIINGIQQRQASLENRLLEIEKRLHLPPAA